MKVQDFSFFFYYKMSLKSINVYVKGDDVTIRVGRIGDGLEVQSRSSLTVKEVFERDRGLVQIYREDTRVS